MPDKPDRFMDVDLYRPTLEGLQCLWDLSLQISRDLG